MGRLSSFDTAKEVALISVMRDFSGTFQPSSELDRGKVGELLAGQTVELDPAVAAGDLDLVATDMKVHRLIGEFSGELLELLAPVW